MCSKPEHDRRHTTTEHTAMQLCNVTFKHSPANKQYTHTHTHQQRMLLCRPHKQQHEHLLIDRTPAHTHINKQMNHGASGRQHPPHAPFHHFRLLSPVPERESLGMSSTSQSSKHISRPPTCTFLSMNCIQSVCHLRHTTIIRCAAAHVK